MGKVNLCIMGMHGFIGRSISSFPTIPGKFYIFDTECYTIFLCCTSIGNFQLISPDMVNNGMGVTLQGTLREATPQEEFAIRMEA